MIDNIIREINSKNKILILGFGREGKSTYNLIRKHLKTKHLTIADGNKNLLDVNEKLESDPNLTFILGENYLDNLDEFDLIIKSPGINFKYINYEKIIDKITSQIDLFLRNSISKTIGVTGTKGKSTTASLIYHVLKEMNKDTILVGNIGIPVFDKIDSITNNTFVVLELSCHQLQFVKASPNVSILLNLYEEHLDLYKSYLEYQKAKLNIFKFQEQGDYEIWGIDSPDSLCWFKEKQNTYAFGKDITKIKRGIYIKNDGLYFVNDGYESLVYSSLRKRNLFGDHNLYNVAAAICVFDILGLDMNVAMNSIDTFKPLEHRMELVGTFNGITFYNDSIATIPLATIDCVKTVSNAQTLIIGGMDRGIDLSILVKYLLDKDCRIENCICLKDTGYKIADELIKLGYDKQIFKVRDMDEAVRKAYEYTNHDNACILSPAAASYNTYKNFEERGNDYKRLIKEYAKD